MIQKLFMAVGCSIFLCAFAYGMYGTLWPDDECIECRLVWRESPAGVLEPWCQGPCDPFSYCESAFVGTSYMFCICLANDGDPDLDYTPLCNCRSMAVTGGGFWFAMCNQDKPCNNVNEECDEADKVAMNDFCECK